MYRDKFRFAARAIRRCGSAAPIPAGARHKDEFFGEVETYRKQVRIRIPAEGEGRFDLKVTSQGCADIGVCYVPMESQACGSRPRGGAGAPGRVEVDGAAALVDFRERHRHRAPLRGQRRARARGLLRLRPAARFTPCVLPMIPILSAIIAGEGKHVSTSRARSRFRSPTCWAWRWPMRWPASRLRMSGSLLAARCKTPGCSARSPRVRAARAVDVRLLRAAAAGLPAASPARAPRACEAARWPRWRRWACSRR